MRTPPFRVVVLGLGHAGSRLHLPALRRLRGVEVVAAYDPDPARRDAVTGVHVLDDEGRAVETEADAVVIATPPSTHARLALAAMDRGRHVYVEKPMADTLEGALAVHRAATAAQLTLQVGFAYRFHPLWQRLDALVQRRTLTTPVHAEAVFDADAAEGWDHPLVTVGCHHIDLLSSLVGIGPTEVEVTSPRELIVRWPDGSVLHGTYGDGPGRDHMRLRFSRRCVELDRRRGLRLRGAGLRSAIPPPRLLRALPALTGWERSFELAQAAFVATARRRGRGVPGPDAGLGGVRVGLATMRSLEAGQPVAVEG